MHYDNAPAKISMFVCGFLWVFSANFFLLSKLKTPIKGKPVATIEKIKEKSKKKLLVIPKSEFQKFFGDWKKRWHKCIIFGGYFEGEKIVLDK